MKKLLEIMNWFYQKINTFKKSRFVKDIIRLQSGSIISRLISVASAIIIARVLGATEYGLYSLIFGFVSMATTFMGVEGGSVVLVLLPQAFAKKDRQEVNNIISYFIKVNLLTALIVGLIIVILAPFISDWLYGNYAIGSLARIIIVGTILSSFSEALTLCLQAIRKIKYFVIIDTLNNFLAVIVPLALVFKFGLIGIVWGNFFNNFLFFIIAIIIYGLWTKRNPILPKYHEIFSGVFKVKIKKYFTFGFSMLVDKKIVAFSSSLPLMILGMFVPPAVVGYFKIAQKYVGLIGVLTKPIASLLMVQLPKSLVDGAYVFKKNFEKVSFYTPILSLPFIAVAVIFAKLLVTVFYGTQYLPVVPLIYWLAPVPIITGFGIGLGAAFRVLNNVKTSIITNSLVIILGLPIMYYLIKFYGVNGAIAVSLLKAIIPTAILLFYIRSYLTKMVKKENSL